MTGLDKRAWEHRGHTPNCSTYYPEYHKENHFTIHLDTETGTNADTICAVLTGQLIDLK
jgi:hypothetical protein